MKSTAIDQLSKHVPELNSSSGRVKITAYALLLLALVTAYFIVTDHIPTWSIDSEIIIAALGFLVMGLFFSRKQAYQEKYKELAYRKAFAHYAMPAHALILGAIAHAGYMNGPVIPTGWWTVVFFILGWFMSCIGALLWIRSAFDCGAENLAFLHVYHPEKEKVAKSGIYGILRHPIYAGMLMISTGLASLNGNGNSLVFIIFIPLGFISWIRLVEEKELIERLGKSYLEYRQNTPAFWPKLQDTGKFFVFLFTGR